MAYYKEEIILNSREEAVRVIDAMKDIIKRFGYVSVQDLKDLVGLPTRYLDSRSVWTNLEGGEILEEFKGEAILDQIGKYRLRFPPPADLYQTNISTVNLYETVIKVWEEYNRTGDPFEYILDLLEEIGQPIDRNAWLEKMRTFSRSEQNNMGFFMAGYLSCIKEVRRWRKERESRPS